MRRGIKLGFGFSGVFPNVYEWITLEKPGRKPKICESFEMIYDSPALAALKAS
jgi:hypothetical protein